MSKNRFIILCMIVFLIVACLINYYTKNELLSYIFFIPVIFMALYQTIVNPIFTIDVTLFLCFDGMGLLPSLSISNVTFNLEDLIIPYFIFVSLVVILKYRAKYKLERIGIMIMIFMFFRIIGSVRGTMIYNQSFLTGMLTLRNTYTLLIFFPIAALINKQIFNKEDLLKEIYKFIKVITIVNLIQLLLLYLGMDITNYQYEIRWGYRLRTSNIPQIIGLFCVVYVMLNKQIRKQDLVYAILFALEIILINQSRIIIFGVGVTIMLSVIFNPNNKSKMLIIFLSIVFLSLLMSNASIRNIIMESMVEYESDTEGSMLYRKYERMYFDEKLEDYKILGIGTPNMHEGEAAYYSGMLQTIVYKGYYMQGLYLSDLGVYAIKYYWGIIGVSIYWTFMIVAILIFFYKNYVKKQYNIYNYLILSILILNTIISNTICFFIYKSVFYVIIFLIAYSLSRERYCIKCNRGKNE